MLSSVLLPIVLDAHWASILEILHFQVLQINFCCYYWALQNDPFLFGIRVMFSFVALYRDGFFALQERFLQWWALVMPREVMRSALSPGHRHSLKPARTPEQGGSSLSAECTFSPQCAHSALPVPYYYNVHGCTTALLTPTTCTQRGPRGLISATNPRGAPHASRESHNPAWQLGAL